tara:strand:- start:11969 stop:12601 length:633 start_codon:yes stop_codon:yes gene_type:complete
LLKNKVITPGQGLPPVFPVVLHNGSKPWTAPLDIYEMVTPEPPGFLQVYQPHLRYYLVDEARYPNDELGLRQTPLSGVFSIEKASTDRQGLQQAVDRIVAIIQADPNKERIDKIITRWLKRHLQRLGADVNLDQLNSLVKDKGMLAENLENWAHKERQKVLQEAEKSAFESKRNAARKLIALTEINDQLIAEIEELPIEEVEKLRAETQH